MKLMEHGVYVALVTAAGYENAPEKYEQRLPGLLQGFRDAKLSEEVINRFIVVGGECNYLFRCNKDAHLESVDQATWLPEATNWNDDEIRRLLDTAETALRSAAANLKLRCKVLRKSRAVGIFPGGREGKATEPNGSGGKSFRRELLDEVCVAVQHELAAGKQK